VRRPQREENALPFYQKGDIRIHYEEAGTGFRLLVIPGGGLNSIVAGLATHPFNPFDEFKNEFRVIPNLRETGAEPKRRELCTELSWAVPIDNEHVRGISIVAWPLKGGAAKGDWHPGTDTVEDIRPGAETARSYEERQRKPDDLEAQEGQRAIAVHALENLAMSDSGVVMLRRLLREQIRRVEQWLDPINVVRDPDAVRGIPTSAWNTVLTRNEAMLAEADRL
jgi:hypothetical protein